MIFVTVQDEKQYKGVMTRVGASLLVFLGLISASQTLYGWLKAPFISAWGEEAGYVINELLYGVMYFLCFIIPIFFFLFISKGKEPKSMRLKPRLTLDTPFILVASIGVIYLCAVVNNLIIQPLISPSFDYDSMFVTYDYSEPYKVVLSLIVMAVVPGICEELLFRGMILENLAPYGKTGAVIGSAFLFGLMHQNPLQMFYTTMAGIVLGVIYIYTESIFCSMLVHILNNAYSIFLEALSQNLGELGESVLYLIQGELLLLTAGAIVFLLVFWKKLHRDMESKDNVFERILPEGEGYEQISIDPVRKIRLFFAPTVIVFIVLTVLQMGLLMLVMMGGLT